MSGHEAQSDLSKMRGFRVQITAYTTPEAFDVLASEWNDLLQRSPINTPFGTLEWHSNWWAAYHPGDLWVITVRDENNALIGIASFFIAGGFVHFVGCEDVTDYSDVIVDAAHQDAFYNALADYLVEQHRLYEALDLCNIPSESPTYSELPRLLKQKGFDVAVMRQEVCPIIPLPDDFKDYFALLDKRERKEVARKVRIANAQDSVAWYIVNGKHDLETETDKFLQLMRASHPEKAEFLQNPQHVDFFKRIVPAAHAAGWLQMNFLEVAGEAVAAYVNFDYDNRILVYNSGLDPDKAGQLSPGIVLLAYNIEHAIENKRREFNFLRGDEEYKYRMGGRDTEIFNLKATYVGE